MVEDPRAKGDSSGTSSALPVSTAPLSSTLSSRRASPNEDDDNNNNNDKPAPLRTSQTFPAASIPSEVASGSNHLQDAQRSIPRGIQGNGPIARNSPSSQTLFQASTESSAIDPLSQHIIKRTNIQKSIPLKLLGRASYEAEVGGTDSYSPTEQSPIRSDAATNPKPPKDKKKGVSFLSRFIGTKKKDQLSDAEDDASVLDDGRMDAAAFAQPIGFIPRFPPPPKYIRVRAQYKKERTFDRVFVAQELEGADLASDSPDKGVSTASSGSQGGAHTGKAIWALEFSNDGRYLAAAGQDRKVRVWAVIASAGDRNGQEAEEAEADESQDDQGPPRLKAPVFRTKPVQVYEGHAGSVLALSWSKNNFLLSSSMDKTVRLWHVSRPECLCCFKHSDFVTSIQFHPRDDRFFLAGSLDTKLRLWSIPDKSVAFVATVPDMITSVAFTPDGRYSIAGCLNGLCNIYETDGLKSTGQIHVRSARGRNAKGSKITGIDTITAPPGDPNGDVKLLITSNDSRIRLYNFRDRTMEAKFRGNENSCSQIRASFSDDGKHVICGSEDRRTYIWPTGPTDKESDKRAFEVFETQSAMVTAAIMAPMKAKQTLGFSEDPIYDLCNPPPITLVSQTDPAGMPKQGESKENDGHHNGMPHGPRSSGASKLAQGSPAYLARSTHPDGNIIIVADYSGKIKVLRQDCAYQKRRQHWDTGSISRRLLRRTNSARHSIASSIGKESSHKTPSERIISWRNSVIGNEMASIESSRNGMRTPRTRSPSPHKSIANAFRQSSPGRAPAGMPAESRFASTTFPPSSPYKSSMDSHRSGADASKQSTSTIDARNQLSSTAMVSQGKDKDNPLWLQGDQSYAYWNKITHDAMAVNSKRSPHLLIPNRLSSTGRKFSASSALSSDYASSNGDGDESEVLKCENCRGTNFRGTKSREGTQRLVCIRCHRPVN